MAHPWLAADCFAALSKLPAPTGYRYPVESDVSGYWQYVREEYGGRQASCASADLNGDGKSDLLVQNRTNGAVMTYLLVAENEADLKSGKISVTSPIGKGLLGKKVGDVTEISVPSGTMQFEILEISR